VRSIRVKPEVVNEPHEANAEAIILHPISSTAVKAAWLSRGLKSFFCKKDHEHKNFIFKVHKGINIKEAVLMTIS